MESGGRLNFNSVYLFCKLKLQCHSRRACTHRYMFVVLRATVPVATAGGWLAVVVGGGK